MFTFLDMANNVLFVRDDAERAIWTQEEMSLDAEFPYIEGKAISTGQRIYFKDPSTGEQQLYEVKQARSEDPEHRQNVHAENICISELTDEHMDNKTVTDKTAADALRGVLSGTLWSVGATESNPVSSGELSRGSVWQAILEIKQNWNVYIEPHITLSDDGKVTRKLDIRSVDGTWRGVRLSVDKNMLDPAVTIDDSEVATAIYGYGGTTTPTSASEEEVEITFADIAWSKTADHPAKPSGQKYLEDPEATAAYGRNGRPRFGFYQNTDILDPSILLQKTWENLKAARYPSVSVDGTVADLYRLGYADQPLRLHDIALVEVLPFGFKKEIQIIRFSVDLLDPSASTLTIGAYIPNIVYISKQAAVETTGEQGGRSGRGGGGSAPKQTERSEYETEIIKNNRMIKLRAYQNDLDDLDNEVKLQEGMIEVTASRITAEVTDRREADKELSGKITVQADRITAEVKRAQKAENTLSGKIDVQADKISLVVTEKNGIFTVNSASIVMGINAQTGSYIKLRADKIDLSGYVTATDLAATNAVISNLVSGSTTANSLKAYLLSASTGFTYQGHTVSFHTVTVSGTTYHLMGY